MTTIYQIRKIPTDSDGIFGIQSDHHLPNTENSDGLERNFLYQIPMDIPKIPTDSDEIFAIWDL